MAHEHTVLTPEQAEIAVDYVRHKTAQATLVSKTITDEGSFVGYASTFGDVFDHPDLQGDIVGRHAFDGTLERWRKRGVWPPLLFNHEATVAASMGVIKNLYVDGQGLVLEGKLDLDHPPAEALYKAMRAKRITGLSISYAILDEEVQRDGTNLLLDLELIEISVTPIPANQDAQILSVKSSQHGQVIMDESTFDAVPGEVWHVEQRGLDYCVIDDETGEELGRYPTRGGAVARLVELRANLPKAARMIAEAKATTDDPRLHRMLDHLTTLKWSERNIWLLETHIEDVTGAAEIKSLTDRLDAIESGRRPRDADDVVDAFITAVRLEMVEEKLDEARAFSFNAELNERAAHTGPVPEFDERFAVTSVPTEYESGDTQPVQVVGVESETFRLAVLPGTMRPDNE